MDRTGDVPRIVKQNVFVRFDDPNPVVLEMFLQPICLHQGFRMRVLRRVSSQRQISAGARERARFHFVSLNYYHGGAQTSCSVLESPHSAGVTNFVLIQGYVHTTQDEP